MRLYLKLGLEEGIGLVCEGFSTVAIRVYASHAQFIASGHSDGPSGILNQENDFEAYA